MVHTMKEMSPRELQSLPATHLRVLRARREGFRVEIRLVDGTTRKAWVPRSLVEDARIRLRENRDLIAYIGDSGSLGETGVQVLALLCAQPEYGDPPFTEVNWHVQLDEPDDEHDMTELPTERYVPERTLSEGADWVLEPSVPSLAPPPVDTRPSGWLWFVPGLVVGAITVLLVFQWLGYVDALP